LGSYRCDHCNNYRSSHDDGFHRVDDLDICEECYYAVVSEHIDGDRDIQTIDGQDITQTHFVCPECLEVAPVSDRDDPRREGFSPSRCLCCILHERASW
jgi:hypothetical protein